MTEKNQEIATAIIKSLMERGVEKTIDEITPEVEKLTGWNVQRAEIERGLTRKYLEEAGIDMSVSGKSVSAKIGDITEKGKWVAITAKVVALWENKNPKVFQTGLLGDETGTIKFITFEKSAQDSGGKLQKLEVGKSYLISPVVTDEYNDQMNVKLVKLTTIEAAPDVEVTERTDDFQGVVMVVQKGSGLIRRCPQCNKTLDKSVCMDHGRQEGIHDVRIKAILDNGVELYDLIMDAHVTEQLTGLSVEKAKKLAMDALDPLAPMEEIKQQVTLRRYHVRGVKVGEKAILVKGITPEQNIVEVESIIAMAEGV